MVISMSESIVKHNRILRIAFLSLFALLTVAFSGEMTAQAAQNSSGVNTWSALQDEINSAKSGDTIMLGGGRCECRGLYDGVILSADILPFFRPFHQRTVEKLLCDSKRGIIYLLRLYDGQGVTP